MKRQAFLILTTLSLLVMLTASSVHAQSGMRLRVSIPFEFSVGRNTLPAGEYTVSYKAQGFVVIQSVDRRTSQIFGTSSNQANSTRDESSLVFNQYGDQYFLAAIWTEGRITGQKLSKSRAERDLIRARSGLASGKSESQRRTVTIIAQR